MDSFREEFFPWLCKVQYQRTKRNKYASVLGPPSSTLAQSTALRHSTLQPITHEDTSAAFSPTASPYLGSMALSAPPSVTDEDDEDAVPMSFRVGIVIHDAKDGYVARANNLHSFLSLSRSSLTAGSYTLPTDPKNRSLIDQKASISPDSLIGDSTRVEERATVKKSIIGKHCIIGKMAKITNCILLDHCVVGEGAKLDGSILGTNTKVGSKSELVRCVTQAGYEVEEGETFKNEKLDVSDWAAGPGGSEQSDDDGDDSDKNDDGESEPDDASKSKPAMAGANSVAIPTVASGKVGDISQLEVTGLTSNIAGSTFSGTKEVYRESKPESSEESDGDEASIQESS
ncbi:hypothetical protein HWV62_44075 [Athelia sp. TMB]|nr:hypothetical protein HWV62_44075 [Athelia sp. TMB]